MATDYLALATQVQTAIREDSDEAGIVAITEMLAGVGLALDRIAAAAERLADATERMAPVEVTSEFRVESDGLEPVINAGEI